MCGEGNVEGGGRNGTAFQDQASPLVCVGKAMLREGVRMAQLSKTRRVY